MPIDGAEFTICHYNLRRAEANRILLPSPDSSILFSPLLQAYISNLQKMQNKVHVKWISATQLLIQKVVPKMKRIWKKKKITGSIATKKNYSKLSTSQFYQELSLHRTPLVVGCSPTYVKSRLCHIVLINRRGSAGSITCKQMLFLHCEIQ